MSADQPTLSVSRVFADVNLTRPPDYYNYDAHVIEWKPFSGYSVHLRLGRGKYSDVFLGTVNATGQKCVIKMLKPVKKRKIKREIRILKNLYGGPNIVKLIDVLHDETTKIHAIVCEYVQPTSYQRLMQNLTPFDCAHYVYQLLVALHHCHSQGIIHRDVKPQNMVINHEQKKLTLIDWGLAEFYLPGTKLNVRVASRHYKGPELLVDFQDYDYSLDIWSLGCVLAGMLFKREPFFCGQDNFYQLEAITQVTGTEELIDYLVKYQLNLQPEYDSILNVHKKQPWTNFINTNNQHLCLPEALDLLSKMLIIDHQKRWTAAELMTHPFFSHIHNNTKYNPFDDSEFQKRQEAQKK